MESIIIIVTIILGIHLDFFEINFILTDQPKENSNQFLGAN